MSSVVSVPVTSTLPVMLVAACNSIVPVPPGFRVRFAFELVVMSVSLKIKLSTVTFPVIVAAFIVGDVKTLFVSVCESVSVTTVPVSIAKVTVFELADVLIPFPPAKCKVSLSKSMFIAVESSVVKSKSCAVTVSSTYFLILCCVANNVALSELMSSSSAIPVTVAPVAKAKLVAELNAPETLAVPSTINDSFMLIAEESSENNVVPFTFKPFKTIDPVPFAVIVTFPFVTSVVIELLFVSKLPANFGAESCSNTVEASESPPYNSEKFSLIFVKAVLNGSPVPSFALEPMLIVCFVICYYL